MKTIYRNSILFLLGGIMYVIIELLWRGRSHWTMFIVGGLCFLLIGGLNNWYPWKMSILLQMTISSIIVTIVEFISGCIINIWLNLGVWDYSNMPFNILGQVCLLFTFLWFLLSLMAIVVDDFLRYLLFKEQFPEYHITNKK